VKIDWERYRTRYGNIQRLDLILEMENDSANRYKLSKAGRRADVVLPVFLEEISELFDRRISVRIRDYSSKRRLLCRAFVSRLHAVPCGVCLVLARSDRQRAMVFFAEALQSDVSDVQQGDYRRGHPPRRHGGHRRSGAACIDWYRSKRRCSATQIRNCPEIECLDTRIRLPRAFARSAR